MDREIQTIRCERLRELHKGPHILILPNAWDATSARIFEQAGFAAIGTTSAGIAALFGYPDGERIPRQDMLGMVGRIAHSVGVPVSADIEAGYGSTIAEVLNTIQLTVEAGAAGINLEDGTRIPEQPIMDMDYQVRLIRSVRESLNDMKLPLVINARVDIYLRDVGAVSGRFDRVVERANAYIEAGADCIFVIGLGDSGKIKRLVKAINGPINILAGPGTPTIAELESYGVRRVSFGSGLMRATLPLVGQMAQNLRVTGDYAPYIKNKFTHAVVNRMFD